MKPKVLWIEDGAFDEMAKFAGPVYSSGEYDLIVALDATEAEFQLLNPGNEFAAVIVDIRIPPGPVEKWINLYRKYWSDKIEAQLGKHLLYSILKHPDAEIKLQDIPQWIKPEKFGVFTIESKETIEGDLKKLGITVFKQKTADESVVPVSTLLDLINKITGGNHSNAEEGE
jgi:hypothetical protein